MSGIITSSSGETLQFDVVVSEQYAPKNKVTEYPVEDGSIYSDHIQRQSFVFNIIGIISETPFSVEEISPTRLADAIEFLNRAAEDLVTYTSTKYGIIDNLALEAWSYTNDVMRRLEFQIGFRQVRIATAEIVSIPRPIPPAASPTRPCGEQPAKTEKDVTDPKNKGVKDEVDQTSFAAKGADAVVDFFTVGG